MSMEVLEERVNSLLHRREAKLVVHHEGAGTPDRMSVRKMASDHYKTGMDQVYVRSIATRTGGSSALCVVEVYDDSKSAGIVPEYVKNRNLPKDQRVSKGKKEEKPATPPPKPAAEKKAEPKPAEKKEDAKPASAKELKPASGKEAMPAGDKEGKPAAKEAKPATKPESKPKPKA